MPGRLGGGRTAAVSLALMAVLALITVRAVPHTAFYVRNLPWIVARAGGLAALVLLALLVATGILMSHPTNRAVWKQTKHLMVWHRYLVTFAAALLVVHVAAIVLDTYAHVSLVGALVPGQAGYRTAAVGLGTLSLYAMALAALTAGWAQRLPPRLWLHIHRGAVVVFALAWAHGMLAGSDSVALKPLYLGLAALVGAAAVTRYWLETPQRVRGVAAQGDGHR
jgi:sulfoxide reductase heme-binding subunit YedZ